MDNDLAQERADAAPAEGLSDYLRLTRAIEQLRRRFKTSDNAEEFERLAAGEKVAPAPAAPAPDADKAKIAADLMNAGTEASVADAVSSLVAAQAVQIERLTRERDEALDEVDWLEKGNGEYQHLLRQAEKNLAQADLERDGYASRAERAEAECERLRAMLLEAADHAEFRSKITYGADGGKWQNWELTLLLPVPVGSTITPHDALRAAIDTARSKES